MPATYPTDHAHPKALLSMPLASLGYDTDLIFPRFDGSIQDRGDYLVIRTPDNPGFYWGNLLLFPTAPQPDDLSRWDNLFQHEFANDPQVRHRTFGWDTTDGSIGAAAPFEQAGYILVNDPVLAIDTIPTRPPCPTNVTFRKLTSPDDWSAFRGLNCAADERETPDDLNYLAFKTGQRTRYRNLVDADHGFWLGAFIDNQLVAGCGLFLAGSTARFQSVETHPDFRRRGICSALVAEACHLGLTDMGAKRLVIVAGDGEPAERIYLGIGFQQVQRQVGVFLRPDE